MLGMKDFMCQPVERYRAIMALLFFLISLGYILSAISLVQKGDFSGIHVYTVSFARSAGPAVV